MMFRCCLGKDNKYAEDGKEKLTERKNNKEPGRQSQQEIGNDTNSSIVTSGTGLRKTIPPRNSTTEGPSQSQDSKTKKKNMKEKLGRRKENIENDNLSTSSSDGSNDSSVHFPKQVGAHSSSDGNQGGVVTYNISGKNLQFGNNNKIINYPMKKEKKKEHRTEKDVKSEDKTRYHSMEDDSNCLGNFRKINDETDAIYNLRLVLRVADSVGIIRSPSVLGTGFRVGDCYIMTARHVVMDIINSVPPRLEEHKEDRVKMLGNSSVYIDFDFELPEESAFIQVQRQTLRFNFEPNIYYENEALDTAVLKLKPDNLGSGSNFPPKLIRFAKSENVPLYFVGHNNGMIKGFDKSTPRVNLMEEEYKQLQQWSMKHQVGSLVKRPGYTGADNSSKVLFDCTFNKGASGSPGFIVSKHDHMPYVVTMLLRGYPDWLYDDNVPQKEKINIPQQNMFEQGVRMTEICYDMRLRNPDMAENIFGPKPGR